MDYKNHTRQSLNLYACWWAQPFFFSKLSLKIVLCNGALRHTAEAWWGTNRPRLAECLLLWSLKSQAKSFVSNPACASGVPYHGSKLDYDEKTLNVSCPDRFVDKTWCSTQIAGSNKIFILSLFCSSPISLCVDMLDLYISWTSNPLSIKIVRGFRSIVGIKMVDLWGWV